MVHGEFRLPASPALDPGQAERLAREYYDHPGTAAPAASPDGAYRVTGASGRSLLLETCDPGMPLAVVDLQIQAARLLDAAAVPIARVVANRDGELLSRVALPGGESAIIRALEITGAPIITGEHAPSGAQAQLLGDLAGRTAGALSRMSHPAAARSLHWDLRQAHELVHVLVAELPEQRREAFLRVVHQATGHLEGLDGRLKTQVIHGNISPASVLRTPGGEYLLADLGPVFTSWRVAEVAGLLADLIGRTGSMAVAGRALRAFHARAGLDGAELAALWPLVILRAAVLAAGAYARTRQAADRDGAERQAEAAWGYFVRAAAIDAGWAEALLRLACGLPHRSGLGYHRLLAGMERASRLELGTDSPLLDHGRWQHPGIEDELAARALDAHPVIIAPFGQARLSRVPGDFGADAHARARCVTFWTEGGTAVHAPFAGQLTSHHEIVELSDHAVVLTLGGVRPAREPGAVAAGEVIGRVAEQPRGGGRLQVMRRLPWSRGAAAFAGPHDEYEVDGALDPSALLGLQPEADPLAEVESLPAGPEADVEPMRIARGWDTRLIDTQGRNHLDLTGAAGLVGHGHRQLSQAVARQLDLLPAAGGLPARIHENFVAKLLQHSPSAQLDTVVPVSGRAAALGLALALARAATGRRQVLASPGLLDGQLGWSPGDVELVDVPDPYRGAFRGPDGAPGYLARIQTLLGALEDRGCPVAGFLCEPVDAQAGGIIPPHGYLPGAFAAVRAAGGLVICDESRTGQGRLGSDFWASAMLGALPDIMVVGGAAGAAAAVITRRGILQALARTDLPSPAAGGSLLGAATAVAVLGIVERERLQHNALRVGGRLRAGLLELCGRHPLVGAVHGTGLYQGLELVLDRASREPAPAHAGSVRKRLLRRGVILNTAPARPNVLQFSPALTVRAEEVDRLLEILDRVLSIGQDG